ncbi:MAG: autotransporter outer membrane beta-barrel domain-containing protein [Thermoguttaceae bacterium]|nr:autotransporter outer membrane beta-barrel domain-containing protein [Thermoguttaceae bacterium]
MKNSRTRADRSRRASRLLALATALALGTTATPANAQTGTQLTVDSNKNLAHIDGGVSSIVFTGAYALTLSDGQTLTPIFLNQATGAILNLGTGSTTGQTWRVVGNSPRWTGTTVVGSGNELVLGTDVANPLGAFSTDGSTAFGTLELQNGSTLKVAADAPNADPQKPQSPQTVQTPPKTNVETKIGALRTASNASGTQLENATVDVDAGRTLTVENGLSVDSQVGLSKIGDGVLQLLANAPKTPVGPGTSGSGTGSTAKATTAFSLGRLNVGAGTFRIANGTGKVDDVPITATAIAVGNGATLDLRKAGTVQLAGNAGEVVFSAADGSTVNIYANANGSTAFQATTYNTYIDLGAATLDVVSDLQGDAALKSLTVFTTEGVGQTTYSAETLAVVDNVLGKRYVVDLNASNAEKLVLALEDAATFQSVGQTPNERSLGAALDRKIASGNYTASERAFLDKLENNQRAVPFSQLTGELHASTVGFAYLNNLTTTQTLLDRLRSNSLVAYGGGASSVAPMNYEANGGVYQGGAAGGYFDTNGMYQYETGTDPYGSGVAPIYETGYGTQIEGGYENGLVPNGTVPAGVDGGAYETVPMGRRQYSTLSTLRGQAQYGDPGTLIYSAWFAALGGSVDAKERKGANPYDGDQIGFLTGLDLFGSCDCRFGAFYGYQNNEMKNDAVAVFGKLETKNHLVGLYHQFGDETVYNIYTIRGGYDRYDTTRQVDVLGARDSLATKYDGFNAGATYERGANFALQPFVFSPFVAVDYNFLYREAFEETSTTGSGYALRSGSTNYHSLRGIVGARLFLDMYPGDQHVRIGARGAYIHEFLDGMFGETNVSFAGLPATEFPIYGNALGRDWGLVGLGLDWAPIPAFLVFYHADVLLNEYVDDVYNSVGLSFRW